MLSGRYELRRRLLGGAMGSVWEAYDTVLERRVAAKALISGNDYGEDLVLRRERVRREALALALVDHPAVVNIHDLIYEGDDPWIVMGYVEGPTLAQYIKESPPLTEREVADIGLAVLQGLLACHAKSVYHRDVKPANIIRTPDGVVRLVDFGIARIAGLRTLTPTSKIIGTPEYMAPELFDDHGASQATDLWALGVTMYCALEGRSPFNAASVHGVISAVLNRNPPVPRSHGPLADLVIRMLRKPLAARPDAPAVLRELSSVAGSVGPAGRPGWLMTEPGARWNRRVETGPSGRPKGAVGQWTTEPSPSGGFGGRSAREVKPLTRLSGMRDVDAARIVSDSPTDRAVADLLALEDDEAARIIYCCDDAVAGRLLGAIAGKQPNWTRRTLEMVTPTRAGRWFNNMSSPASASVLELPPPEEAARVLSRADDAVIRDALSLMLPAAAGPLVLALDDENATRVVRLLSAMAPATVARIIGNIGQAARTEGLLGRLPSQFQQLVKKHLPPSAEVR